MSSLPLADCQIEIQRGLTTSSTAIFIPFTTQELYQSGKESLYYGLNAPACPTLAMEQPCELLFHLAPAVWADMFTCPPYVEAIVSLQREI